MGGRSQRCSAHEPTESRGHLASKNEAALNYANCMDVNTLRGSKRSSRDFSWATASFKALVKRAQALTQDLFDGREQMAWQPTSFLPSPTASTSSSPSSSPRLALSCKR